jgi:hypothetical protein
MILEYYFHIGFNKELIMMIYLEGIINNSILSLYSFSLLSFRTANAHTDSLGEVDVIADAEVLIISINKIKCLFFLLFNSILKNYLKYHLINIVKSQ